MMSPVDTLTEHHTLCMCHQYYYEYYLKAQNILHDTAFSVFCSLYKSVYLVFNDIPIVIQVAVVLTNGTGTEKAAC